MCFFMGTQKIGKIAKKDIKCFKLVYNDNSPIYYGHSPGSIKSYSRIGKVYYALKFNHTTHKTSRIRKLEVDPLAASISCGIHSYKILPYMYQIPENLKDLGYKVIKCVIPKGAEYFYDENSEQYVSTEIKRIK